MPVEQVADLLAQWREASGVFSRSRVLTQAIQALSSLTPDERRTLARALAEQGAPDLAAQVEDRTGGTVRASRFSTVADGLLALEDDELDRLVAGLRDPDTRERLARETLEQAAQGPPAPPGSRDAAPTPGSGRASSAVDLGSLPPPGAGPDWRPPADTDPAVPAADDRLAEVREETRRLEALPDAADARSEEAWNDHGVELGSPDLVSTDLGGQELDEPSLEEVSLGSSTLHEIELDADEPVGPDPADGSAAAGPAAGRTAAASDPASGDATRADPSDLDVDAPDLDVSADDLDVSADDLDVSAADLDVSGTDLDADAADLDADAADLDVGAAEDRGGSDDPTGTRPDRAATGRSFRGRLRDATSPTDRLAIVGAASEAGITEDDALALVDAIPDGWQRRRAAQRLAEAGRLPTDDLPALFRRFARDTDATFVAGSLLATDAVTPDDLEGSLPERTVRRLRSRTER